MVDDDYQALHYSPAKNISKSKASRYKWTQPTDIGVSAVQGKFFVQPF